MGSFTDYRGLEIRTPDPVGDGGLVLNNNFKELSNRSGPIYSAAANPTVNDDKINTAGNGKFYIYSKWLNTTNDEMFVCVDATATAAIWEEIVVIPQITETLYVDGNRTDNYTEDGSILKPYKTVQAATAAASGDTLINIAPGEYTGNISLGSNVTTIRGSGLNATHFTGDITASDRAHTFEKFRIKNTGSLTITSDIIVYDAHIQGPVTVTAAGFLEARSALITTGSGVVPLTVDGGGILFGGFVTTSGNVSAIVHTDNPFVLFHSYVQNNSFVTVTVNSSGGACGVIDTQVINAGFGSAISLNNGALVTAPNSLDGVVAGGAIACGAAHTRTEGLNFLFGALTGTNLIYRPASHLDNDSAAPGATVKDALADLDARVTALGG